MLSRLSVLNVIQKSRSHQLRFVDCQDCCHQCSHFPISDNHRVLIKARAVLDHVSSVSVSVINIINIMSKRGAVEKLDLIQVVKKTFPHMAARVEMSCDGSSGVDRELLRESSDVSSVFPAAGHQIEPVACASSAQDLDDSGIDLTAIISQSHTLACSPNVPGFVLNPPKSCSGPSEDAKPETNEEKFETVLTVPKDKSRKGITKTEHDTETAVEETSRDKQEVNRTKIQATKERLRSAVTSEGGKKTNEENTVQKDTLHGTGKRGSTQRNGDRKKLKDSSVVTATGKERSGTRETGSKAQGHGDRKTLEDPAVAKVTGTKLAAEAQRALSADTSPRRKRPRKKKKTVLPVSLLNCVVRTVQDNIGSISRHLVEGAAASSGHSPTSGSASGHPTASQDTPGSVHTHALCSDRKTSNGPNDDNGGAAGEPSTVTQHAAKHRKDAAVTTDSSLCLSDEEEDEQQEEANPDLSVECVGDKLSGGETVQQKAKKKSKKTKKKFKREQQRKSGAGDWEDVVRELPGYIPDSDSRLHKQHQPGQVYHLSALFSGELLKKHKWSSQQRKRPNYFFSIQITNPEIKAGLSAVQQRVEAVSPALESAMVGVQSAHLTLGVMFLPDNDAVMRVIAVMDEFRQILQQPHRQWGRQTARKHNWRPQKAPDTSSWRNSSPGTPSHPPHQHPPASLSDTPKPSHQVSGSSGAAWNCPALDDPAIVDCRKSDDAVGNMDISSSEDAADNGRKSGDNADRGEKAVPAVDPDAKGDNPKPGLTLEVRGLDTFNGNVVFAKVTQGPSLDQVTAMAEHLRDHVMNLNIHMDTKPFAPHITLMKMSKNREKLIAAGVRKIDSSLYRDFKDVEFGVNVVTNIQLCSMVKPKRQDGYYHVEHQIPIPSPC